MSAPTDSTDSGDTPKTAKTDDRSNQQRKGSVSKVAWCCMDCDVVYTKENDMLLQCQYCEKPKCISCLGMTKAFYKQVSGRDNFPWFCDKCLGKAIESVKTTKSIEDRCNEFMFKFQEKVESRFKTIESEVAGVKQTLAEIKSGTALEEEDGTGKQTSAKENIVKQATTELQSRLDRRNNIAFYGVVENTSNLKEMSNKLDAKFIIEICEEIGVALGEDDIKQVKRYGKKGLKKNIIDDNGQTREVDIPRVLIVTFSEDTKIRIMKNAFRLSTSDSAYFRSIGIKHDMTKEERLRDRELKIEAKEKTEKETENFMYVVRGLPWERRIVKIRKGGGLGMAAQGSRG